LLFWPPGDKLGWKGRRGIDRKTEGEAMTRILCVAVAVLCSTAAFAQDAAAPPKPPKAKKPPAAAAAPQAAKPKVPMGCKAVGAVKGIKIWAGDCVSAPSEESEPAPQQ
jgi:hypothetical protein